jgi:hypothetical protein
MSSVPTVESLEARMSDLSRRLDEKDLELDEQMGEFMDESLDEIEGDIEETEKNLKDDLKRKVEAIRKGVKARKDDLKRKVDSAKKGAKEHVRKDAKDALDAAEKDLSDEDLSSAYVNIWVARHLLKASK